MQPKAIKLANASVMPVTTGFKVVRRVTTGAVYNFRSYFTEQFGNSLFLSQVTEYNAA